jgi:8-oxo-dGTP diphosphatase
MIDVVAGIITQEGKVLLARRAKHKSLAGKWEFPGGKIEDGETPEAALSRELQEEFNIQTRVNDHLITVEHSYDHFDIRLISFHAELISGEFILTDHDQVEWVSVADVQSYNLAPADIPIAKHLVTQHISSKNQGIQ